MMCTSFIPYIYCTDLSKFLYSPIVVRIIVINVTTLCLIKEPFKEYYCHIYSCINYLEYLCICLIYLLYRF